MIIKCDKCGAKFKMADSKLKPSGVKVRCSKCKSVFLVQGPSGGAVEKEQPAAQPSFPPLPDRPEKPVAGVSTRGESIDSVADETGGFSLEELLDDDAPPPEAEIKPELPSFSEGESGIFQPVAADPGAYQSAAGSPQYRGDELSVAFREPKPAAPESSSSPPPRPQPASSKKMEAKKPPAVRKLHRPHQAAGHSVAAASLEFIPERGPFLSVVLPLLSLIVGAVLGIVLYLTALGLPVSAASLSRITDGWKVIKNEDAVIMARLGTWEELYAGERKLVIRGEIFNPLRRPLESVNIIVSDAAGNNLGSFDCCSSVQAGGTAKFSKKFDLQGSEIKELKIKIVPNL